MMRLQVRARLLGDKNLESIDKSGKIYKTCLQTGMVRQEEQGRNSFKAIYQTLQGSWTKLNPFSPFVLVLHKTLYQLE